MSTRGDWRTGGSALWLAVMLSVGCISRQELVGTAPPLPEAESLSASFRDNFDRNALGFDWHGTGGDVALQNGALVVKDLRNRPLWLRKRLPNDVRIEFDVKSVSNDIKVEIFGDGKSYDPDGNRYTATGYVLVMGAWNNSKSIIARKDEHGGDIKVRKGPKVVANKTYHWTIERRGNLLRWLVDNKPFLVYDDANALTGKGHEFFAFSAWQNETHFDNLVITPL